MAAVHHHVRRTLDTADGQAVVDLKTLEACVEGWVGDAGLAVSLDDVACGLPNVAGYRDGQEVVEDRHPLGQNLKPKLCSSWPAQLTLNLRYLFRQFQV